jgi:hypothetical protein
MNRRDFLKKSMASVAGAALASTQVGQLFAAVPTKAVRVGWIGTGSRGISLLNVFLTLPAVEVVAVCDIKEEHAKHASDIIKKVTGAEPASYTRGEYDYRRMLERNDLDAVIITTPTPLHCPMTIDAMSAGKHVGCEVPGGYELEDLWNMVKIKEKTGKRYMLFENYCYMQNNMMIYNMAMQGVFGETYYAECSYIHSVKSLYFNADGSIAWRGIAHRDMYGNWYPTHALGPVAKWFDIDEGDRMDYCTTMAADPRVMHDYSVKTFGKDSSAAKIDWKMGDFISTLIHTVKGKMIRVDFDLQSHRPASNYYLLQGTGGVYDSRTGLYLEGKGSEQWNDPKNYLAEYNNKYWRGEKFEKARNAGHGGGDYFVLDDFTAMVRNDREPWIDVYDSAAWSSLYHCSKLSLDRKSVPVDMPDFTSGKWKQTDWRKAAKAPMIG